MLLLMLAASMAEAKCAMPRAFLAGMDEALPPDPVIWVFAPGWGRDSDVTVLVDGRPAGATAELVSFGDGQRSVRAAVEPDESGVLSLDLPVVYDGERTVAPSFVAWRVSVDANAGSRVEVTLDGATQAATVAEVAPMAPRDAVSVENLGVSQRSWTCSFEDTRRLRPSEDAPAYRVEWAVTEQAWKDGERHVTWMPRSPRWFGTDGAAELAFGHLNCAGYTMERKGRIWASVIAVYPDGSETPQPAEPVRIDVPG